MFIAAAIQRSAPSNRREQPTRDYGENCTIGRRWLLADTRQGDLARIHVAPAIAKISRATLQFA